MKLRAFVTLLFLGICGAGYGHASTLGPIVLNCLGTNCGTLDVATNADASGGTGVKGDISAAFTGLPGLMAALPACCGHFNWLNIVTAGTADSTPRDPNDPSSHAGFPLIDPGVGGNLGFAFNEPADRLPFFYDEKPVPGDAPMLQFQIAGDVLNFYDHPGNAAGVTWTFKTYLVLIPGAEGQTSNKEFYPLAGFTWTFTENQAGTGQKAITNLGLLPINAARIAGINQILDQEQNGIFSRWTAIGAARIAAELGNDSELGSSAPEPGNLIMLLGGLGLIVVSKRRRVVR